MQTAILLMINAHTFFTFTFSANSTHRKQQAAIFVTKNGTNA